MQRTLFTCASLLAFTGLLTTAPDARAASYAVNSTLSYLTADVQIGAFFTGDPNDQNTWELATPEAPGAFWFAAAFATGQGDHPDGSLPAGDGTRVPGSSNGLTAQIGGTLNADLGTNSLPGGSALTLLDSGSWQLNSDPMNPLPELAAFGIFFDPANPMNSEFPIPIVAAVRDGTLDITSSDFLSDPAAVIEVTTATLTGFVGGLNIEFNVGVTDLSTIVDLNGNLVGTQLTLPLDGTILIDLEPELGLQLYAALFASGQVVATVPEPTTLIMLGIGVAGLAAGRRRSGRRV